MRRQRATVASPRRLPLLLLLLTSMATSSTTTSTPSRILLFVPTLSHSHVAFNAKIAETLAQKGHQVVLLLALVDDSLHYNSSTVEVLRKRVGVGSGVLRQRLWSNPGPYEDSSPLNPVIFAKLLSVSSLFVHACRELATDKEFLMALQQYRFDVGLVEQYDSCGFGLFEALGVKATIWLSATAVYRPQSEAIGVDLPFSYVPELFAPFNDEMTFAQKVQNSLIGAVTNGVFSYFSRARQSMIFDHRQDLLAVSQRTSSVLVNAVPFFDYSAPTSTQVEHVAGLTVDQTTSQPLSYFWQHMADSSTQGFVIVSFGGIARTVDLPLHMQRVLFASFASFPQINFVVKLESNATTSLPLNVVSAPWIPQLPLMKHPNYRAIITHGGWSSILETVMHGRPMILMPLFADHAKNAKVAESKGVALLLDKLRLRRSELVDAIHRILFDPKYRWASEKYARMFADSPSFADAIERRVRQATSPSFARFRRRHGVAPKRIRLPTVVAWHVDVIAVVICAIVAKSL